MRRRHDAPTTMMPPSPSLRSGRPPKLALRARGGTHALACCAVLVASALVAGPARAADDVVPGAPVADPATLLSLGVFWPITGDDDGDATASIRFREVGASTFRDGMPLHRVRPEVVTGLAVEPGFGGSLFDLRPNTSYEVELTIVDPDGGGATETLTLTTRAVPADPVTPNVVTVDSAAALDAALANAAPGDVIELAPGVYTGPFSIDASGTPSDPIVVRGAADGVTILDGGGCSDCNVLEVYGSFTHLEWLTFRNANRALRFQGEGTEGNVLRRARVEDTNLGVGGRADQRDFYLCDNDLEGPLVWPHVYTDDGGANANVDGIVIFGTGHVVCHNRLVGWGDALKMGDDAGRANDFYGNEILSAYDNGLEFDGALRNVRAVRNRFSNGYAPISFQPVFGGPVYAVRNVVSNVAHEQLKFHSLGGTQETSGIYVLHNTFLSPARALTLSDSTTSHHFVIANNLFLGNAPPEGGRAVEWTGGIDDGVFDFNGYAPDGRFNFEEAGDWPSFALMQAAGTFESNGVLLDGSPFASGLAPTTVYTETVAPSSVALAASTPAVDAGRLLANLNDGFEGRAPDLGAVELGCAEPLYGPRPGGVTEEDLAPCGGGEGGGGEGGGGPAGSGGSSGTGNAGGAGASSAGGAGGAGADDASSEDGCSCEVAPRGQSLGGAARGLVWLGLLALLRRRMRRARAT